MAYTKNPHLPKVRMEAVRLVKYRKWTIRKVARYIGVEPSTISRWCKSPWGTGWIPVPTRPSTPKTNPRALPRETIEAIIKKRVARRRCGQVIYEMLKRDGIAVSLSSVQRVLSRTNILKKRSPWKRPHDATPRPEATRPGALVQVDTVHFLLPDGSRLYVYTLIDLFSRWAYAAVVSRIGAEASAKFIKRAQKAAPFAFETIQSDHGPEFSIRFTHRLLQIKLAHRHARVRQSNDNAHVERFNRTLEEECLDKTAHTLFDFRAALKEYLPYYNGERLHMGIQYQTPLEVLRSC
jgi:transposase InsO family protein